MPCFFWRSCGSSASPYHVVVSRANWSFSSLACSNSSIPVLSLWRALHSIFSPLTCFPQASILCLVISQPLGFQFLFFIFLALQTPTPLFGHCNACVKTHLIFFIVVRHVLMFLIYQTVYSQDQMNWWNQDRGCYVSVAKCIIASHHLAHWSFSLTLSLHLLLSFRLKVYDFISSLPLRMRLLIIWIPLHLFLPCCHCRRHSANLRPGSVLTSASSVPMPVL